MLHSIGQRRSPNVHIPCLMRVGLSLCCLLFADVSFLRSTSHFLWCLTLAEIDVNQPMHTGHGLFIHTLDNVVCHGPMSLASCIQTTLNAWKPWQMVYVIGQYCLVNAFMIKIISPSRCTLKEWYVQAMSNVTKVDARILQLIFPLHGYCLLSWMMSHCWCTQATSDVALPMRSDHN